MTASPPEPESQLNLSGTERLELIQCLYQLPESQFEALVYALDPPSGIISGTRAPQGDRVSSLLEWVECPTGPGIRELIIQLGPIVGLSVPHLLATKDFLLKSSASQKEFNKTTSPVSLISHEYLLIQNQNLQQLNRYIKQLERYIAKHPNAGDVDNAEDLIWRLEQLRDYGHVKMQLKSLNGQPRHIQSLDESKETGCAFPFFLILLLLVIIIIFL